MPSLWADSLDEHRALVLGRLLDAYESLHAERSFEAITMSAVAREAGIARSAIYNYVADKHELAIAHAERLFAVVVAEMEAAVRAAGTAPDRIRAYVRETLIRHATIPASADDLMPVLDDAHRARLLAALQPLRALLEETVALGVAEGDFGGDPSVLGLLVWSTLAGLRMPVAAGQLDAERTAAQVADVLLDGMCRR